MAFNHLFQSLRNSKRTWCLNKHLVWRRPLNTFWTNEGRCEARRVMYLSCILAKRLATDVLLLSFSFYESPWEHILTSVSGSHPIPSILDSLLTASFCLALLLENLSYLLWCCISSGTGSIIWCSLAEFVLHYGLLLKFVGFLSVIDMSLTPSSPNGDVIHVNISDDRLACSLFFFDYMIFLQLVMDQLPQTGYNLSE